MEESIWGPQLNKTEFKCTVAVYSECSTANLVLVLCQQKSLKGIAIHSLNKRFTYKKNNFVASKHKLFSFFCLFFLRNLSNHFFFGCSAVCSATVVHFLLCVVIFIGEEEESIYA